jgi:NAD(P)H-nitrite reductase large subunit
MYDYVIIGNGIAGLSCAQELRNKGEEGSILIVSEEESHTYWRTRLSELISKDFKPEDTLVKKDKWYEDNKIEEKLNTRVKEIKREDKLVVLENGEEIEYDKVLIATGSHPFIPPIENADSEGVFAIRTMDDLLDFKKHIDGKENVIIIGGGILGLEAAYSVSQLGIKVLVIESFPYLLSRQLDKDLSLKIADELKEIGIETSTGKNTKKILTKDGKVCGVELDDGTKFDADAVMIQAGVRMNTEVADNSGLEVDRGIVVSPELKTEDDSIYAAGDCAQIGKATIGLWTASTEMGKIAANNLLGGHEKYETPKPFSSLLIGPIKVFSAGQSSGEGIEEIKKEDGDKIYKLFKKDGKFVGGILWQDTKYQNDVKNIVFEGKDPKETKLGKEIFGF